MGRHRRRPERARYRDVFAVPEYRALLGAYVGSLAGDQLARVALSVLVFDHTGSALLTALTYALTFLPAVIGGPLLAGLADRLPRRRVMIASDLGRGVLVALMAAPWLPLGAVIGLVLVAETLSAPFTAARAAMLPDVLDGDRYVVGSAVQGIAFQFAQVLGFALGGVAVATLHPRGALALDAATFFVSAAVLRAWVRERPVAAADRAGPRHALADMVDAARLVFGNPRLRGLACSAWLWTFFIVPEGLAAPYAASLGGGSASVGLLLAAAPFGTVVGAHALARLVEPDRRMPLVGPLAVLAGLPLIGFAAHPGLGVSVALLVACGAGSAYNIPANAGFMTALPAGARGRAFGLVQAGILTGEGLGLLAGGALAGFFSAGAAITAAGACGAGIALALSLTSLRPRTFRSSVAPERINLAGPTGPSPLEAIGANVADGGDSQMAQPLRSMG